MIANSPIVVGGSGGSGTRLIAEILVKLGVYMGQDFNKALDNLVFPFIFKHPHRLECNSEQNSKKYKRLFSLHEKLLLGYKLRNIGEISLMIDTSLAHRLITNNYDWKWVKERWQKAYNIKSQEHELWGWKAPISIFFMPGIYNYYKNAKFVLLMRNGLDMAYSNQVQQHKLWSECFGVENDEKIPQNRFEFWYRINKNAIEIGKEKYKSNFKIIKLEEICTKKEEKIRELASFIGVGEEAITMEIIELPKLPKTHGRYRKNDTSWIDSEVERKLSELGYDRNWIDSLEPSN